MKEKNINQIKLYISKTLTHPIDNEALFLLYYQIGAYLFQQKFEVHDLKVLEWKLQKEYGIVIGFTKRNFMYMMQFCCMYSEFTKLKDITWQQCVSLLRIKDPIKRKEQYQIYVEKNNKKTQENYLLTEIQKLQKNKMQSK